MPKLNRLKTALYCYKYFPRVSYIYLLSPILTLRTNGVAISNITAMKRKTITYIFCLLCVNSFAQPGEWTWMSGDNYFQSVGHYGIQGIPDTANYPPAVYEPCDWYDKRGNFWVFGGYSYVFGSNMADLWKYNPLTNEWTWMKGIGVIASVTDSGYYGTMGVASPLNRPAGRGWGTPTWSDDNGNFWIYGGTNSADLWKYNIATNEWTWMQGSTYYGNLLHPIYPHHGTFQVPDSMNTPGNRSEVTASWTDNNENLWLFGGDSRDPIASPAIYNDMWKYDVSVNKWVWMNGPDYPNDTGYYGIKGIASPLNRPPARMSYAKWKDPSGNFYLFGGINLGSCGYTGYNDVWKYNINLNNWIWIGGDSTINNTGSYASECTPLSTNIPRNGFENRSTCYDSVGNVFMFGSIGCICPTYTANTNELWQYSTIDNEWTLLMQNSPVAWGTKGVSSPGNSPPKTFGSLGWYLNNEVWIFGGSDDGNSNSYNSMWRYKIDRSCFPTGISASSNDDEISFYPNPFCDNLNIEVKINRQTEIILYDISARKLLKQEFINSVSLNTKELAKGIYIYEVRNKNGVYKKGKVVKN